MTQSISNKWQTVQAPYLKRQHQRYQIFSFLLQMHLQILAKHRHYFLKILSRRCVQSKIASCLEQVVIQPQPQTKQRLLQQLHLRYLETKQIQMVGQRQSVLLVSMMVDRHNLI